MSGSYRAVWLCAGLHIGNDCGNRQFGLVNQIVITPNLYSLIVLRTQMGAEHISNHYGALFIDAKWIEITVQIGGDCGAQPESRADHPRRAGTAGQCDALPIIHWL
jgi:hypothetical protein